MPSLTDISYIRSLCEKYGVSLAKGFGQNFLVNPGICPKICDVAGIGPGSNVLEIGPGFGTLTQQLAARAKKVVAIEVDTRLLPVLQETLAAYPNAQVVQGDVLECNLNEIISHNFNGEPVAICGNLPYYITSPILMRLLESRLPNDGITVMVQKEAAERITTRPGTRAAGAISYAVWYYSRPQLCFAVKPGSFYPPPKVTSAVIHLAPAGPGALADQPQREQRLFSLIRGAFSQRRKTLVNAASAGLGLPKEQLAAAVIAAGLPPMARPEQLTLEEYILLEALLWP